MMTFEDYRLPSGEIVRVDATAAKAALFIGFTLESGASVTAERVGSREDAERRLREEYSK